jgi:DNA-binding LytR/AlgR family response regulator
MMKCIAIDNDFMDLSVLKKFCDKRGSVTLEIYASPERAMVRIQQEQPDVVILNIEPDSEKGLETAFRLPATCCLIFTTAHPSYAPNYFEVNVVGLLRKPYSYEQLTRALDRAEEWHKMHDLLSQSEAAGRHITLKSEYKNVTIAVESILYVESLDNYVRVHLTDGRAVTSKVTLQHLVSLLPPEEFIRIHRSYLVALSRIAKYTRSEVVLSKINKSLPVGKTFSVEVYRRLEESLGGARH